MIFTDRRPYRRRISSPEEAALFDRYLQSRNGYKQDFFDAAAGRIGAGPVLEWSGGYGAIHREILSRKAVPLCRVCDDRWSCDLRPMGPGTPPQVACRVERTRGAPLPFRGAAFEVVVSANLLHEWDDLATFFHEAHRLIGTGGAAFINDLRRDSDPFITEYVIHELAGDATDEGRYRLDAFLRSLRSAYTVGEVVDALGACGLPDARVEDESPMTLTVLLEKRR
jgi:SAM-dependent methyltransferase